MTTPSASPTELGRQRPESASPGETGHLDGRGICFWYQATRMARASASCRYRMGHLAEQLRGATTISDPLPPLRTFDRAEVVVVIRPHVDRRTAALLARLRRRGLRLVADFDDLLFAGDPGQFPLVLSGALDRTRWASQMEDYRQSLDHFDAFTVSTEPLAELLSEQKPGAQVTVVPNGVSPSWVRQGRALYLPWQPGDPPVIRFLPGSPSHDADLAAVAGLLGDFLRSHPAIRLEIVGPLGRVPDSLPVPQVSQLPRVPYPELPRLLAASWLTLAPLADTAFNRCKSALKFLESAAFGTPCLASANPDMEGHAEGGVLLAHDDHQWRDGLQQLLDDERRTELGRQGRRYVDERGCATVGASVFTAWLDLWRQTWPRS